MQPGSSEHSWRSRASLPDAAAHRINGSPWEGRVDADRRFHADPATRLAPVPRETSGEDRHVREDAPADFGLGWWFLLDPAPRYLVSHEGALLLANPAGQAAIESGQFALTAQGAFTFGSTDSDHRFKTALLQVARSNAYAFAILRKRHGGWLAADIHSVPERSRAIVAFREAMAATRESMAAISEAFQLTRSEGSVLHHLLDGACPKSAANHLNLSEHTVRAHLRSIYAKMGVRGLVEMVRMCGGFM